jgi:predicted GNAT family acetyltransferase
MDYTIIHNEKKSRFELSVEGHLAHLDYIRGDGSLDMNHTLVPKALEGRGIGSALARFALDYAVANDLKVIPTCPFIKVFIDRHPVYQPLTDLSNED